MKYLICILLLFSINVYAHQPKLINHSPSIDDPVNVIFPEISKAYYSKLTGQPHYYVIQSEDDFLFYTSILSPKVGEDYTWFSLEVLDGNQRAIPSAITLSTKCEPINPAPPVISNCIVYKNSRPNVNNLSSPYCFI